MKLLIDDANIDEIRRLYDLYPIDGVTTNPSILAKSGRQPYDVLKEIREFIGEEADLHVQVIAKDAEGMIEDAHRIATLLTNPSITDGATVAASIPYSHSSNTCCEFLKLAARMPQSSPWISKIS